MSTKKHVTYWSLDEYAAAAEKQGISIYSDDPGFAGATFPQALELARKGWTEQLKGALDVAESAIEMATQDHVLEDTFTPAWDVTGAEVDVARYLSGEPECMIDFPLTQTSKVGRVITLCASIAVSGSIQTGTIRKRGQVVTALALALSRLGHSTEIWADLSTSEGLHIRILVKGVNDELDPSRIMFAYAHPASVRVLGFSAIEAAGCRVMKSPRPPEHDLPEGTIYLPEIRSAQDVPNADVFLRKYLRELGLLADGQ